MSKRVTSMGVGRHMPRQHTESPTVREAMAESGVLVCKHCKAEHHDKHWYAPGSAGTTPYGTERTETLCPGCQRVERHIWEGEVVIEGRSADFEQVTNLLRNVEQKCWHDNPTSKICSVETDGKKLIIKTTTQWLATRFGKELKKSCKGSLDIKRSPEKDSVHVHWIYED